VGCVNPDSHHPDQEEYGTGTCLRIDSGEKVFTYLNYFKLHFKLKSNLDGVFSVIIPENFAWVFYYGSGVA
jgi:hypothetical protein